MDQQKVANVPLPARFRSEREPQTQRSNLSHWSFFRETTPCSVPGGGLGGGTEFFTSTLEIDLDLGEAITCTFKNVLTSTLILADGFESGMFPPGPLPRPEEPVCS